MHIDNQLLIVKSSTICPNLSFTPHKHVKAPHLHQNVRKLVQEPLSIFRQPANDWRRRIVRAELLVDPHHPFVPHDLLVEPVVHDERRRLVQERGRRVVAASAELRQPPLQPRVHRGVGLDECAVDAADRVGPEEDDGLLEGEALRSEGLLDDGHRRGRSRQGDVGRVRHEPVPLTGGHRVV